ncbi:potassium channel [Abditibacteriota bacterium]|nr:potassium channel [Abditibacteriota bacterium]
MTKSRLEAFSDGVIAILITIMVLEMKVPHGTDFASLRPILPVFLSYILSFIYIGIYWNNHHHMFQVVRHVRGPVLWANLHLLFWLSLIPFVTGWMGENHFQPQPVALYGVVLFCSGGAYFVLAMLLIRAQGENSTLKKALGSGTKEKISMVSYAIAIGIALFANSWVACAIYVAVALVWLVPDTRIERRIENPETKNAASE